MAAGPHLVATWGGTGFNFEVTEANFQTYIDSAVKYHAVVTTSGTDIVLSNHTTFDGPRTKLPAMAARKAGDPNPYVIGNSAVQRYVKIAQECAGELVTAEMRRSRPTAAVDHFASDTRHRRPDLAVNF
jgi:metallo-beta-lactamase class B